MAAVRRLEELARHVSGEVVGDSSLSISGLNGLAEAGPTELSFYGSSKYRQQLQETRAAAVLINGSAPERKDLTYVRVGNPHLAFAKLLALLNPQEAAPAGIAPGAYVHPTATVHPSATVMVGATVMAGATIGPRAVLHPHAHVGEGSSVGEDTLLYPGVVVRERCTLGNRVIIHGNTVIGADGFGFALDMEKAEHFKIPQTGTVRIEDDVEIGACCCVDRATLGETVVGRGTKIDNLVQIAHNVKVGPFSLICAQVGVSGSTEMGQGVVLAGQVGVVGHVRVGNMVKVGAQSGVAGDLEDGAVVSGSPAVDHRAWLRSAAAQTALPDLLRELRQLRKKVDALEKRERGENP
ncbi:MAG: UDP-3-O-(3-hydroxymyristoyl)glucosamine N-acyltransferase [Myxococcaceae bacterium]